MNRIILCLAGLVICCLNIRAQQDQYLEYDNKSYEISAIKVTGNQFSDEKAIIGISGLKVGQKIVVPGQDIPNAIKAIYKQRLFTQVEILISNQVGDVVSLEIRVKEKPRYSTHSYKGVKKSSHEDLNTIVSNHLPKNSVFTEDIKAAIINNIEKFYHEKGYLDAKIIIHELPDEKKPDAVKLLIEIDKGKRVKISNITFSGNKEVSAGKLRKQMKETKRRWKIFSKSKFQEDLYEIDKENIITYYNSIGFRNAEILDDSIWRTDKGRLRIHINLHEGNRFYFRNIVIKGNSLYPEQHLKNVLGIQKGDVYNQELLQRRLSFAQDGRDISSLYMDEGHLFFRADPVETAIENDSVDIEIRITEGPPATIDKVIVRGNDRTHEHVIRRELRTRPGQKFSRSDIIRSQRAIMALGFFNPESLGINTPVNARRGTVDIEYSVEERPSDQLELSAGWSAYGVIGTLGVVFNNFSTRNFFKKEAWSPLPQGDGQKLSLRAQTNGRYYQSYNASFTEPWLGGSKPTSLTVGGIYSYISNYGTDSAGYLSITRLSGALGSQLTWPDDNFAVSTAVNLERIRLVKYPGFSVGREDIQNGDFYNLSLKTTFIRSTVSDPLYPRSGSRLALSITLTPPYSLLRPNWNPDEVSLEERYRWVEYHKWRIDGEWYLNLADKLVLSFNAKMGILGYYNKKLKAPPFERFVLGGDGLNNQSFTVTGRDIFALRGYDVLDVKAKTVEEYYNNSLLNPEDATIFNKFTMELRYPLSLNPSATIYATMWAQGGNSWTSFKEYNPFELKRSAGFGLRVFLPMFGLLGFDYGIGFDKPWLDPNTTSIKDYAKFSLILGFEPE
jgi:outer membrane protein insertion porin family